MKPEVRLHLLTPSRIDLIKAIKRGKMINYEENAL